MPAVTLFESFVEEKHKATHNFSSNTFKVMLTNTAPVSTNTIKANLTEISAGNGYTAGGATTTVTLSRTADTLKILFSDVSWTASGGSMATFRYFAVYNDTDASDKLVCYGDLGSSYTLASGSTFTIDFDGSAGAIVCT